MHNRIFRRMGIAVVLLGVSACQDQREIKMQINAPTTCLSLDGVFAKGGVLEGEQKSTDGILWLNPSRIRKLLLEGDTSLIVEAIRVHIAKDTVNLDRANLLPRVNLGALAGAAIHPTFAMTSVAYALPFLVPNNWVQLNQDKILLNAEKMTFLIADLNEFASAYAIYQQAQVDFQSRDFLTEDLQDAISLERTVEAQYSFGRANEADVSSAKSAILTAKDSLLLQQTQLNHDQSSMVKMLGLCSNVPIAFLPHHLPQAPLEVYSPEQGLLAAEMMSPELRQLFEMYQSAKQETWKQIFSFVSDVSASESANPIADSSGMGKKASVTGLASSSSSNSFRGLSFEPKKLRVGGGLDLSFAQFYNIQLSNDQKDLVFAEYNDERKILQQIVQSNLPDIQSNAERIETNQKNVAEAENAYKFQNLRYAQGQNSLTDVITARGKWREARLNLLKAQSDLDNSRINLHRLTRSEEFENVRGCWNIAQVKGKAIPTGECEDPAIKRKLGLK